MPSNVAAPRPAVPAAEDRVRVELDLAIAWCDLEERCDLALYSAAWAKQQQCVSGEFVGLDGALARRRSRLRYARWCAAHRPATCLEWKDWWARCLYVFAY